MLTDPPSGSCRVKRPRSPSTAASPPGPTGPTSGGLCGCLRRGDGGHFHEDDQGCRRGGDAGGPAVDGAPAAVESSQTDPVQLHLGSTVLELLERSEDAVDVLRWWGVPVVDRPRPRTATTAAAMLSPASVAGQQDSPEHHVHPRRRQGAGQTTSCPSRHGRPVCDTSGCGHHDRSSPNPRIGAVAAQAGGGVPPRPRDVLDVAHAAAAPGRHGAPVHRAAAIPPSARGRGELRSLPPTAVDAACKLTPWCRASSSNRSVLARR